MHKKMRLLVWVGAGLVFALWFVNRPQPPPIYEVVLEDRSLEPPVRDPMPMDFAPLGFLTPDAGENKILPLYGRRLQRDRWQYYTISNQHNDIKLPIKVGRRSGLDSTGVNELGSGDRVLVHGYNEMFTVSLYDTEVRRYLN